MKTGYLCLETHSEHPGIVRFFTADRMPDLPAGKGGTTIRYLSRFNDIEAAQMHVQNSLHGSLVDVDTRRYKADLLEAMAVVESDDLTHTRVWIDPSLNEAALERVAVLTKAHCRKKRRFNNIWLGVGYLFAALLVLQFLGLF